VRDRGESVEIIGGKQAETGENRPQIVGSCRKAVRDIKHRYFDDFGRVFDGSAAILSGMSWRSVGVVEICRAGVGASAFGNFGRFRCRRTKAPLFR